MPSCVVKLCKNNSITHKKSQGITFDSTTNSVASNPFVLKAVDNKVSVQSISVVKTSRQNKDVNSIKMSRDDRSVHILRKIVLDLFFLVSLIGSLCATNYIWKPFERGFFCGDESLMFPYRSDTVTVPMLRIFGLGLPILAIIICEWALLRKEREYIEIFGIRVPVWIKGAYCSLMGFALGICFAELTANVAKNTIGRPRPHFFELCRPSVNCSLPEWQHRYIQSHEYVCMGSAEEKFKDMRMSFLSGHSSWSAYTMMYLALYLETRMVWSGTRVLRHTLQFVAVMMSWFTALSRVSDYKHHWSDVLAGYFMGFAFAVLMWNWGTDFVQKKKQHAVLPQSEITGHIILQAQR